MIDPWCFELVCYLLFYVFSGTGLLTRLIVLFAIVDFPSVVQLHPFEGYLAGIPCDFSYSGLHSEETPFDCFFFRLGRTKHLSATNVASFTSNDKLHGVSSS